MTDQELLQAIGQVVEAKMEPMRQDIHVLKEHMQDLQTSVTKLEEKVDRLDQRLTGLETKVDHLEEKVVDLNQRVTGLEGKMTGVRVYIDTDLHRTLNLLLEGQQALWNRFVPQEQYSNLESRIEILELAVKRHSQEIRELKRA